MDRPVIGAMGRPFIYAQGKNWDIRTYDKHETKILKIPGTPAEASSGKFWYIGMYGKHQGKNLQFLVHQ